MWDGMSELCAWDEWCETCARGEAGAAAASWLVVFQASVILARPLSSNKRMMTLKDTIEIVFISLLLG